MNLGTIFTVILYQPLLNALIALYHVLGKDMGIAIIVLTLIIKALLFYPSLSQLKAQRALQQTQPKLKELREKYKDNKEKYNRAVLQFYRENKVNPLSSCLPLLIQLPILWALYRVFIAGAVTDPATGFLQPQELEHLYAPLRALYAAIPIHPNFLGVVDLSAKGSILFALLTGAATFWQSWQLTRLRPPRAAGEAGKDEGMAASINRSTLYTLPLVTVVFAYSFPTGLALYWLTSTLFQVGQQHYFFRRHPHTP